MRRTKTDAAQTRETIFRAGIKVFAEKGYAGGTMADIACEAGVTRGAIYWHFRNKDAFFRETVARLNGSYDELINEAFTAHTSILDAIATTVSEMIRRFVHDEEFRTMQELLMRTRITRGISIFDGVRPIGNTEHRAVEFLAAAMDRHELVAGWAPRMVISAVTSFVAGSYFMIVDGRLSPGEAEINQLSQFVRRALEPERPDTASPNPSQVHAVPAKGARQ